MSRWKCSICGWIYDPAEGHEESGLKPGTAWEGVPAAWRCPLCGAMKKWFEKLNGTGGK